MRTSRAAIAAVLAVGMLLIGASTAHALTALTTDLTATAAQYGTSALEQPGAGRRAPGEAPGPGAGPGAPGEQGGPGGPGERLGGDTQEGAGDGNGAVATGPAAAVVQPARQLTAGGSQSLPFTGLAAIPVLLVGVALLAAGLALHGRGRRMQPQP